MARTKNENRTILNQKLAEIAALQKAARKQKQSTIDNAFVEYRKAMKDLRKQKADFMAEYKATAAKNKAAKLEAAKTAVEKKAVKKAEEPKISAAEVLAKGEAALKAFKEAATK